MSVYNKKLMTRSGMPDVRKFIKIYFESMIMHYAVVKVVPLVSMIRFCTKFVFIVCEAELHVIFRRSSFFFFISFT
jgi:hypothetical protein